MTNKNIEILHRFGLMVRILQTCERDNIVTNRADFEQGMESMSYFKMNTVTENHRLIYAAATVI